MNKKISILLSLILAGYTPAFFAYANEGTTYKSNNSYKVVGDNIYVDGVKLPHNGALNDYSDMLKKQAELTKKARKALTNGSSSEARAAIRKEQIAVAKEVSQYESKNEKAFEAFDNYADKIKTQKESQNSNSSSDKNTNTKPPKPTSTSESKPYKPTSTSESKPYEPTSTSESKPYKPTSTSESKPYEPTSTSESKPYKPTSTSEFKPSNSNDTSQYITNNENISNVDNGSKVTTYKSNNSYKVVGDDIYVDGVKLPHNGALSDYSDMLKKQSELTKKARKAFTNGSSSEARAAIREEQIALAKEVSTYESKNEKAFEAFDNYADKINTAKSSQSSNSSNDENGGFNPSDSTSNGGFNPSDSTSDGGFNPSDSTSDGGFNPSDSTSNGGFNPSDSTSNGGFNPSDSTSNGGFNPSDSTSNGGFNPTNSDDTTMDYVEDTNDTTMDYVEDTNDTTMDYVEDTNDTTMDYVDDTPQYMTNDEGRVNFDNGEDSDLPENMSSDDQESSYSILDNDSTNSTASNSGSTNSTASNSSSANSTASNSGSANSTASNGGSANSTASNGGSANSTASNSGSTNSTASNGSSTNSTASNGSSTNSTASNSGSTNSTASNSGSTNSTASNSGSGSNTLLTNVFSNSTLPTSDSFLKAASSGSADELAARRSLISSLYYVVGTFSLLLGLGLMAIGAVKLKRRAENPNDPKSFPTAIIITFIAGALIFNYSGTSSTLISTLLGSDAGHCFVLKEELSSSGSDIENGVYENCWDSSQSANLDDIASKVDEMTDGNGSKLKENVEIIVGLFQLIGLIYLIKGIYGLKLTAEGNGRDGYMKPIVTMISAALVIDLPHTLIMLNETIKLLGFGGGS